MNFTCTSFHRDHAIPGSLALCVPDEEQHVRFAENRNPGFEWSDLPAGTKSLVLVAVDPDAPSEAGDVNQEGRVVPGDLPRVDFFHWLLVDIPSDVVAIQEGEFSEGVTPGGKDSTTGRRGTRQGVNDYTKWFDGDADMAGEYFGYDGPCPPWNDSIAHRYHFTLYALDLERCPVGGSFKGPDVLSAIEGHILSEERITGLYSLNPDVSVSDE
jgi:Raf kinase inhibitor-like YbhB/YbcL family protein